MEKIREGLQLVLGGDIFTPTDQAEPQITDAPIARGAVLAREYKASAAEPRARTASDPPEATHAYAGTRLRAWGRFEGDEPDKRFRVLAGSDCRKPVRDPENTTYDIHVRLDELQGDLVGAGVLDGNTMTFTRDHVFDNWTVATRVVSGKATHSDGCHCSF